MIGSPCCPSLLPSGCTVEDRMPMPKRLPCLGPSCLCCLPPVHHSRGDLEPLGLLGKEKVEKEGEREEQVLQAEGWTMGHLRLFILNTA